MGVRVLVPQALRGNNGILAERIASALYVNGNDLSHVNGLDLRTDISFVNLLAQAGDLFFWTGWEPSVHRLLCGRVRVSHPSPFHRHTSTHVILPFCESLEQRRV